MRLCGMLAAVVVLLPGAVSAAGGDDLFALPFEDLARVQVHIATGTPKPLMQAPAAATVITAAEIEALGAQDLDEALQGVPGLHVSHGGLTYEPRYFFRGIFSNNNPHTLVLVNGIPMTSLFVGDRLPGWQGVPVKAIQRIEIIRGPGSAVYGADAFAGVINIITKGADDMAGGQAGASYGSFNTAAASLLQAGSVGNTKAALMLAYRESDGDDRTVEADWAKGFDQLFGTSASKAPGPLNRSYRNLDARLDLSHGPYRLRASWQNAWDIGAAQGLFDALDPKGRFDARFGNVDLSWSEPSLLPGWGLEARGNYAYKQLATTEAVSILPPGVFCFPGSPSCFPEGMQEELSTTEAQAGAGLTALYSGLEQHRLRLGAGFSWSDLYRTTERKNFDASGPGLPMPLPGGMTDVSDTLGVFQPEAQRTNRYLFAQDEWRLAPDWELTAGLRYDHYSDFGDTTNPRAVLVWNTTPTLTSKLLYGEAFRAPSFSDLYVRNTAVLGNPGLKPEKLRNWELDFNWSPSKAFSWGVNLYRFRIRDFIEFAPDMAAGVVRAQNVGRYRGEGVETELRYQLAAPLQLLANFSAASLENEDGGEARGQLPRHTAYLRTIWDVASRWQLTGQLTNYGRFERQTGDPREDLDGYTTFDLTLRNRWSRSLDFTLSGRNLFDADAREASNGPAPPQTNARIPNDLPQPGRTVLGEVVLRW